MLVTANIFEGKNIYIVGIKGTGCAALVELLKDCGCHITGSDTPEHFYTDVILQDLGIAYFESFCPSHLPSNLDFLIHSAAYGPDNSEIAHALSQGIPVLTYPQALGQFSRMHYSVAIAGVHGKTTTTALCGMIARGLNTAFNLGVSILVGSAVPAFGHRAVLSSPGKFFIAETCEYRRHFLEFSPYIVLLTSVEWDHQDFFTTPEMIFEAFVDLCLRLPQTGTIVYAYEDAGVQEVIAQVQKKRPDLVLVPYGETAPGPWKITDFKISKEVTPPLSTAYIPYANTHIALQVPGTHNLLNAAGALAIFSVLMKKNCPHIHENQWLPIALAQLKIFTGTKRRSEIIGQCAGVLVMDDYGHHPTAIHTTLKGIKDFYQPKRLVVSFMSHTFSRTAAHLSEFAQSLDAADVLILHKIYASAREVYDGGVTGYSLFDICQQRYPDRPTFYIDAPMDALNLIKKTLQKGDLFLTLGAGDNFHLSHKYYQEVSSCTA
ncbi:MAG: UDP-N-acetylmuramate--L-alanine ligase [Spirochaetia bacterium]